MNIQEKDNVEDSDSRPVIMFIARGVPGNRWYEGANGEMVLKDEYAENIPEALVEICKAIGWRLIVFFAGRSPEFDGDRRKYSEKHANIAVEMDFSDFDFSVSKRKGKILRETKDNFSKYGNTQEFKQLFEYKGVNFADQIQFKAAQDIPALSANMQTLFEFWNEIFKVTTPKIVIAGRLDVMPYVVSAAKQNNVHVCNVKLGVGEEMLLPFAVKDKKGGAENRIAPDVTILWGSKQKTLIQNRFPDYPTELVVSGRTRNDSFAAPITSMQLDSVRKNLSLKNNEEVILFGGNSRTFYGIADEENSGTCCLSPYSLKASIETLANYAAKRRLCKVIVKPHPVDDCDLIEEICKNLDNVIFIHPVNAVHNSILLSLSDIFVSSASSMFTEAITAGCLPINLWINDVNYLYEFERKKIWGDLSVNVESIEKLPEVIEPFLDNEELRSTTCRQFEEKLPLYAGRTDGLNSERAVALSLLSYSLKYDHPQLKRKIELWAKELNLKISTS